MNRSILADMLADEFDVTEAVDGEEALEILAKEKDAFSLVLLDIVMPRKDGFDVLAEMNRTNLIEDLPVVMVSAETASAQIERAYELGATDFIMRPFDAFIVHRRVLNTIFLYVKQRKLLGIIEAQIAEKEQNSALMVDILSHIVEFRNGESGPHIRNVRIITDILLRKLLRKTDRYALTERDVSAIIMASALHDIGKIGIDDKILNKPGRLTKEEFAAMQKHTLIGANMLEGLSSHSGDLLVRRAYEICRWHHERWDGGGYPDGLKGDDIPVSAQIVALADVYDALTSERVYKSAVPPEEAKEMILAGKCGAFNPLLAECLVEEFDQIRGALAKDGAQMESHREVRNYADAAIYPKGTGVSERTLKLLDYERMKYNFYAELTEEIQFEYLIEEKILKLSPSGAKRLGVEQELADPARDLRLQTQLGIGWYERLMEHVRATSPALPEFRHECQLRIGGELRWYNIIVRTFWTDGDVPVIESVIGKAVDIHDTHVAMTELKEKSIRDPLTGLLNREGVSEQLPQKLAAFPERKFALAVFDIDFFKKVNDVYGHLFGDKVLCEVAERLVHSTRVHDLCARIGGDEFLIVFDYEGDIRSIIARVFKSLCGKVEDFDVTVSMGVVEMTDETQDYEDLFRKADIALYASKQGGRANYHFYDDSMGDGVPHREG